MQRGAVYGINVSMCIIYHGLSWCNLRELCERKFTTTDRGIIYKLIFWQEKFEKQILSLQPIGRAFAQWFNITAADSVDFLH